MTGGRLAAWLVAVVAFWFSTIIGLRLYEDGCWANLSLHETGVTDSSWWVLGEHCSETLPDGTTQEATTIFWYLPALVIPVTVGAWYAMAGLAGAVAARRAWLVVGLCSAAFLVAGVIYFGGFGELFDALDQG
jgi:hypothetical protein